MTEIIFKKNNKISDFESKSIFGFKNKSEAEFYLENRIVKFAKLQDILFSHKKYSILVILQGVDASGKDSLIKHVFSGLNPQGINVHSFGTPTREEHAHDYLWRCNKALPERGFIGVFNRSYYEEVLISKVHQGFIEKQQLPNIPKTEKEFETFWETRYKDINNYEKYLTNNGTVILKFFLNISKDEQRKRFLKRIEKSAKNWKFRADDLSERANWNKYVDVYTKMLQKTSTDYAPWYIVPADHKWIARPTVCDIAIKTLSNLDISYPEVSYAEKRAIIEGKQKLLNEDEIPLDGANPMI